MQYSLVLPVFVPEHFLYSYRDQFALLAEATAKEREEVTVREKAQNQVCPFTSGVEGLSVDVPLSLSSPSPPLSSLPLFLLPLLPPQMAQQLRRELRQRTEKEIQRLQESLDKEEDVAHFRQLDAQSLKHKLNRMTLAT